jgi:hypothetical protein
MLRYMGPLTIVALIGSVSCQRSDTPHALQSAGCASPNDSARAAQLALDTASKRASAAYFVREFRCEPGGYSILTLPVRALRTDGDLTVHVSANFRVTGFGPDSA